MQLRIGLFHQLDPKLLWVTARTVDANSVVLLFLVWEEGVDDDLSPLAVLEELERHKSLIEILLLYD
jgi:hypothetical protein